MALEEVGRVGIRAVPDTKKFGGDLRKAMSRIERTNEIKVRAKLDERSIKRAAQRLANQDIEFSLSANTDKMEKQIERAIEKVEDRRLQIQADAHTLGASAQIAYATRPRTVTIFAHVSEASLANVATTLAGLSGARLISDALQNTGRAFRDLDRNLPKLAAATTGVASLASVAFGASASLFSIGASLASISGTVIPLPGIMAGTAIGIGVTVAAFKDMSTVLADLGPMFTDLQDVISRDFWAQAAGPIRELANTLMPQLERSLKGVADASGAFFGEWATQLQAQVTPDILAGMMDNLEESIRIATKALEPLVSAFTTLGEIGSEYLPRLAGWFVDASNRFDDFITQAARSGELEEWADRGIFELEQLGRVIAETSGILAGIADAAADAGFRGLEGMADGLERMHAAVDDPAFQEALSTLFVGAAASLGAMGDALGPLNDAFKDIAPTLAEVLELAGEVVGILGTGIAEALQRPELQTGLVDLLEGIKSLAEDLAPALQPVADLLGTFLSFVGEFAEEVGPVLGGAMETLAPILEDVLAALEPLLPVLADFVTMIVDEMGPGLTVFANETVPELVEALDELLVWLNDNGPAIGDGFDIIFGVIDAAVKSSTNLLRGDFISAMEETNESVTSNTAIMESSLGKWATRLGESLGAVAVDIFALGIIWGGRLEAMRSRAEGMANRVKRTFTDMRNNVIRTVTGFVLGVVGFFQGMGSGVGESVFLMVARVITTIRSMPERARGALIGIGTTLYAAGISLVQGFINGITARFARVQATLAGLTARLPDWKGPAELDKVILRESGELVMSGFVDGLESSFGDAKGSLEGFTNGLAADVNVGLEEDASGPLAVSLEGMDLVLQMGSEQVLAKVVRKGERQLVRG